MYSCAIVFEAYEISFTLFQEGSYSFHQVVKGTFEIDQELIQEDRDLGYVRQNARIHS